jgi:aspartokinase
MNQPSLGLLNQTDLVNFEAASKKACSELRRSTSTMREYLVIIAEHLMDRTLKMLICLLIFGVARAELNGAALEAYLLAQRTYSEAISSKTAFSLKAEAWLKAVNAAENAVSVAAQEPEPLLLLAQLLTRLQIWSKAETAWQAYFAVTEGSSAARALMANVQFELALQARDQKKFVVAISYLQ